MEVIPPQEPDPMDSIHNNNTKRLLFPASLDSRCKTECRTSSSNPVPTPQSPRFDPPY
eukprot:NODE_4920_length_616_cov_86.828924_g4236_i0.p4 GENE.NODE_4920_length_616_cov_86.828924_g4236_i0~~NODE_4920_length_616_cov_86.828924_g4236_i0.p4  ORF type:complete len:58 (+),score=6.18 NODE_4920_length_616_cov_86.828924_g4236_i0:433-606(+)